MPDHPKDDADCKQQNQRVTDEGTYCGAMKDGKRDTSGRFAGFSAWIYSGL